MYQSPDLDGILNLTENQPGDQKVTTVPLARQLSALNMLLKWLSIIFDYLYSRGNSRIYIQKIKLHSFPRKQPLWADSFRINSSSVTPSRISEIAPLI